MSADRPGDAIRDYIRANRDAYTPAAIRQRLLDAGHAPEAIDAAWAASEAEAARDAPPESAILAPPVARRTIATVQFWALLFVSACLAFSALPIMGIVVLGGLSSLGGAANSVLGVVGTTIGIILLVYLLIAAGGAVLLRRDRAAGYGVFAGLAVAFVMSVILGGICAALITTL